MKFKYKVGDEVLLFIALKYIIYDNEWIFTITKLTDFWLGLHPEPGYELAIKDGEKVEGRNGDVYAERNLIKAKPIDLLIKPDKSKLIYISSKEERDAKKQI